MSGDKIVGGIKKRFDLCASIVAAASGWSPVGAIIVIFFFWVWFNGLFYAIEKISTGQSFLHVGDVVLLLTGVAFSARTTYICAVNKINNKGLQNNGK